MPIEAEVEGEIEELGCVNLALEHHGKEERFDLLVFDQSCSGGSEAHELIAVGHHAWASSGDPESWTAATITPAALNELDSEQTDLKGLFKAAENIEVTSEGSAVEEGESDFVDVPSYTFEAPASAFAGTEPKPSATSRSTSKPSSTRRATSASSPSTARKKAPARPSPTNTKTSAKTSKSTRPTPPK